MLLRGDSLPAGEWSVLCAADRPDHVFSPSFAAQAVVFLYPFFSNDRKEMAPMTMPKRETNSIWSKVREDIHSRCGAFAVPESRPLLMARSMRGEEGTLEMEGPGRFPQKDDQYIERPGGTEYGRNQKDDRQ